MSTRRLTPHAREPRVFYGLSIGLIWSMGARAVHNLDTDQARFYSLFSPLRELLFYLLVCRFLSSVCAYYLNQ